MSALGPVGMILGSMSTPPMPTTSLKGRTVVITGANTGLGYEASMHMLRLGVSHLILGCRNMAKGEDARSGLLARYPDAKVEVWPVDLCSYRSVIEFCKRCSEQLPRLDDFVANAGVMVDSFQLDEGSERTITVNVNSTFLMSLLLLPKLRESAKRFGIIPHLTITGSMAHLFAQPEQLTKCPKGKILQTLDNPKTSNMADNSRYFLSKLIVTLCVREFAKHAGVSAGKKPEVIINMVNPGWCATELHRDVPLTGFNVLLFKILGRTAEVGGRTLTDAIIMGKESDGQYLSECKIKQPTKWVLSSEGAKIQRELWQELMVKLDTIVPGVSSNL